VIAALDDRRHELTDAARALQVRTDDTVPWWAIELVDLREQERDLRRVRRILRYSRPRGRLFWNLYAELLARAEATVCQQPIEAWRALAAQDLEAPIAQIVRDAALHSPRAFCQLVDLRDEDGFPIVLKDLHLHMLAAMRHTTRPAMIQAFWGAGKSFISSTVVPLMDWGEWPGATEGRIYLDEDLASKWTNRLMQIVENNEPLHQLFPWIRKPVRGDPGFKIWSTDGFAIGGNPIRQRSFEAHTIGSSKTGFRYSGRTGVDDIVNEKQAATPSIQDHYFNYIKAVALTMRQQSVHRRPRSRYGTIWSGFYVVGTPYDPNDVNVRLEQEYKDRGYRTVRIAIFIDDDPGRPRWPERDTPQAIRDMREEMGTRAFNMRCRLKVGGREHSMFPEPAVDWALKDGRAAPDRWRWCVVPERTKVIVGFDPASGRKAQRHGARYPAWTVYGLREVRQTLGPAKFRDFGPREPPPAKPELFHHVIQWGRMEGLGFHSQCQKIVEVARTYNCPVAFEDNGLQAAYGDEIRKIAPDVQTFCHTTSENLRDPTQGVEQFEPILANQHLVIHAEGAPPELVKALRDEFIGWPKKEVNDLMMALWIGRRQFALHVQNAEPVRAVLRPVPDYVRRFTGGWIRG
jgi:hypothetical protein